MIRFCLFRAAFCVVDTKSDLLIAWKHQTACHLIDLGGWKGHYGTTFFDIVQLAVEWNNRLAGNGESFSR